MNETNNIKWTAWKILLKLNLQFTSLDERNPESSYRNMKNYASITNLIGVLPIIPIFSPADAGRLLRYASLAFQRRNQEGVPEHNGLSRLHSYRPSDDYA